MAACYGPQMLPGHPIAVFDSGAGGFTVVQAFRRLMPLETIHYLGDTARLPYGTKSPAVVERYAANCARFLLGLHAKILVVACNTASAHALPHLQAMFSIPVLGVIEPGAGQAVRATRTGKIGVLATEGTVISGAYPRAVAHLAPSAKVLMQPCPLFVPFAEEGLFHHPATEMMAQEYLSPLLAAAIDTLILGCTHYPVLRPLIQRLCGREVVIVDGAAATAAAAHGLLAQQNALTAKRLGPDRFFATDVSDRLTRVASAFLGEAISAVELVDI